MFDPSVFPADLLICWNMKATTGLMPSHPPLQCAVVQQDRLRRTGSRISHDQRTFFEVAEALEAAGLSRCHGHQRWLEAGHVFEGSWPPPSRGRLPRLWKGEYLEDPV
jgi:hypothetical protein